MTNNIVPILSHRRALQLGIATRSTPDSTKAIQLCFVVSDSWDTSSSSARKLLEAMPLWRSQGTLQSALICRRSFHFFFQKKKKCRRSIRVLIEHSTLVLGYSVHEITDMLLILFSLAIPTGRPKLNTILVVGFN